MAAGDIAGAAERRVEHKRRKRELTAIAIAVLILIAFAIAQTELPPLTSHTSLISNLAVILLFDLSFLLLGLLLFLVGRNIAKVAFERRRGLAGSRLQARLVIGFIAVALLPTAFLLYVSESFLRANIDSWFNPEYEQVLDDSMEIAESYYLKSASDAMHYAQVLAGEITRQHLLDPARRAELRKFVADNQQKYNLGTVEVFSGQRDLLVLGLSPRIPTGIGVSPESPLLASTLAGHSVTRTDPLGRADVVRGSAPIFAQPDSDNIAGAIVVDYYLPKSLAKRAAKISHTFEEYLQLRTLKQPLLRSYILVLALIGLVVVLLASWLGMFLARGITVPIKMLAQGTQAIAAGDLGYRIPPVGDDEIGHLVNSFNRMTADLQASDAELERRRRYTETLLRNVSAGVIALDRDGRVMTINPCAERFLGVEAPAVAGHKYGDAFAPALVRALEDSFAAGPLTGDTRLSVRLDNGTGEIALMVTASPLADESGNPIGTLLFFEDVSRIAKVERMEAWREVARRIAHEIKNPLTPIRISAERMRRQIGGERQQNGSAIIDECTRTIIAEVEGLKRLVDEFSRFARMPQIHPMPGDLNALIEETVDGFRETAGEVEFVTQLDPALPTVSFDREALKRVLVNLLDNALAALAIPGRNGATARVEVRSAYNEFTGAVSLEVADNGPGIDPRLRTRIFEPHFSTKPGGTGLGLAIVSNIVTDHRGFIRVRDNQPRGSRFILEFPVRGQGLARFTG